MLFDIERSQVLHDQAEAKGLLGYPDVLGKTVEVLVYAGGDTWTTRGTVTALGPIGFRLRVESTQNVFAGRFGDFVDSAETYEGRNPVARMVISRFFPWSLCVIDVVERVAIEPDERGGEPASATGASEPTADGAKR